MAEASAAAAAALAHLSRRSWPEPPQVEPITELHPPRIGVFVCHCGSNIAGVVDVARVAQYARTLPDVVHAQTQMFSCASDTQEEIVRLIREKGLNRVVVAACSPKTHEPIFLRVLMRAGLNPFLLEMVNLRNQDSWVHRDYREEATIKAMDMVRMGVDKARLLEPLEVGRTPVVRRALVVGGGIAGMTAAINLACQGYETHLVEKERDLGGLLRRLREVAPAGLDAHALLETKERELAEAGVHVHLGTEVEVISGHVGNFHARLSSGEELDVGAVSLATGAVPYQPTQFSYGHIPQVVTNLELEAMDEVPGQRVTFVACVGSRTDTRGCSRYCCQSMMAQALRLRRQGKKVRILYKDIRTFSRQAEQLYEEAMRAGVQFIRYDPEKSPEEVILFRDGEVMVHDTLLGKTLRVPTDLLVLVVGLNPAENPVAQQLKVPQSEDGFLLELHPKLGPAEAPFPGIYLAGTCQAAKDVREAVAQGLAAAAKAGRILAKETIEKDPLTARLIEDRCIYCGRCVPVCPFGAIEMLGPIKQGPLRIIEAACQGCGACAAECNFDAILMPYFTKEQIMAQIEAALAERPQEKVLVFACNWCSYAGADQAGIEKIQYPPSARIIRTMCSARVQEDFIARAFQLGAGAVLVTGCRLTEKGSDCHYNYANRHTQKRFEFWRRKFSRQGIAPERLQLAWVSAAEGKEFAAKMWEMDQVVKSHAR